MKTKIQPTTNLGVYLLLKNEVTPSMTKNR